MHIVLVCVDNFQEYILINIRQLHLLQHECITVITNACFFEKFIEVKSMIHLINVKELEISYVPARTIDTSFRNKFWELTSSRFFYIQTFMKKYKVTNIIHIENDVLLYYNTNILLSYLLQEKKIWIPRDSFQRSVSSILYIPNSEILNHVLSHYDNQYNDMINFARLQDQFPDFFSNFPIGPYSITDSAEIQSVTNMFPKCNMIFDAAAIGQYLGGIDPRNIEKKNEDLFYINPTCVIKYNNYVFIWIDDRPYIIHEKKKNPIFNLHIHSKRLKDFSKSFSKDILHPSYY